MPLDALSDATSAMGGGLALDALSDTSAMYP